MNSPGIGQIVENNVIRRGGSFIFKYIYGNPEIRDWEIEDSIIIPLTGKLKIITPRITGKLKENHGSYLRLPESALRKSVTDIQEMGFFIKNMNLIGTGNDYIRAAVSRGDILGFETLWKALNLGYTFQYGSFFKDDVYFGMDSSSRIWSNSRELITIMGEKMAEYISEAISGLEKFVINDQRDERIIGKEKIIRYSADDESFREILKRIGRNRINMMKREKNGDHIIYCNSVSGEVFMIHYGNGNITLMPIGEVGLNSLMEYVELIEKMGGAYLG